MLTDELVVGQVIDVVQIVSTSIKGAEEIYPIGSTGIIKEEVIGGKIVAIIGNNDEGGRFSNLGWIVYPQDFKRVGRLTVTKVKEVV